MHGVTVLSSMMLRTCLQVCRMCAQRSGRWTASMGLDAGNPCNTCSGPPTADSGSFGEVNAGLRENTCLKPRRKVAAIRSSLKTTSGARSTLDIWTVGNACRLALRFSTGSSRTCASWSACGPATDPDLRLFCLERPGRDAAAVAASCLAAASVTAGGASAPRQAERG